MTLTSTRSLVDAATDDTSAVLAFNVITLEHAEAIVTGAERAGSPVLLQVSENAVLFHGGRLEPLLAACREVALGSPVPVALHLDHFQDASLIRQAVDAAPGLGVSSIMIDAAHLPFAENESLTAELTRLAHAAGLWVEAELGEVGGKDGAHAPGVRTDPADAATFAARTGVNGLAVAVGSSHAMTTRDALIDLELVGRLAAAVPVPLVLHGSSGVSDALIRAAIARGIRKVNIGTALNIAFTGEVRSYLAAHESTTDPRSYLREARAATSDRVTALCSVLDPAIAHQ